MSLSLGTTFRKVKDFLHLPGNLDPVIISSGTGVKIILAQILFDQFPAQSVSPKRASCRALILGERPEQMLTADKAVPHIGDKAERPTDKLSSFVFQTDSD